MEGYRLFGLEDNKIIPDCLRMEKIEGRYVK